MPSHPQPNNRRLSRRSGSPSGLSQATTQSHVGSLPSQPAKRIKEEPSSDGEAGFEPPRSCDVGEFDEEDVVIPSADPDASEAESHFDLDEDEADESDGGIRALASRTRQARGAGGAKWDADGKRARFNEKYGHLTPQDTLSMLYLLSVCSTYLTSLY